MRRTDPELHARRRREILEAAEDCFARNGFHGASMAEIAATAGVSMGLLYRYFANKEAIIESFAAQDSAAALAAIEGWAKAKTALPAFRNLVRRLLDEAMQPETAAIVAEIYAESLRNTKLRKLLARYETLVTKAWAEAITRHRAAGTLRGTAAPEVIADLLLAAIDGYSGRRLLSAKRLPTAELEAVLNELTRLIGA
ncbi:MAG: TetR/AcrR family transcriptional regulator [Proteobacteria bacterium]|nr:TetR/AcrR family transcriptional regulator [Pseudomonadota bacterium]